ncbi:MAG: thioredoxin family protein [Planctomycetota bacterium]
MKSSAITVCLTVTLGVICTFGCKPAETPEDVATSDVSTTSFGKGNGQEGSELGSQAPENVVLMKFGATWCPPCRKIDRELVKLERMGLPLTIKKIDVDEQPELAERYRIGTIPRLILLKEGRKIGDKTGFMTSSELSDWVESNATVRANSASKSRVQSNPFFSE